MLFIKKKIDNRKLYLIGSNNKLLIPNFEKIYNNKTYAYKDGEYFLINELLKKNISLQD